MKFGLLYDLRNPPRWYKPENELYNEFLEHCEMAEDAGWDCIWICEHHYDPDTNWIPSALTLSAAVAARTKRIKIGTGIIVLPQHDPVRVAEATTVLDHVSNGRFRLGVAIGYRVGEYRADNIDRKERIPRMTEGIKIIQKCFTEDKFSYDGRFWKITDMTFSPKPISKPYPPIYVAANSKPAAARAGRLGVHAFPSANREIANLYYDALKENGHEPSQFEFSGLNGSLFVSEDPEKDWEEAKEHVMTRSEWYHYYYSEAGQRIGDTTTLETRTQRARERFVDVQGAIDHVEQLIAEVPQMTEIVWFAGYPGMPLSKSNKSLELFAKKVMPRFHQ